VKKLTEITEMFYAVGIPKNSGMRIPSDWTSAKSRILGAHGDTCFIIFPHGEYHINILSVVCNEFDISNMLPTAIGVISQLS
jgi:hypothetical protein